MSQTVRKPEGARNTHALAPATPFCDYQEPLSVFSEQGSMKPKHTYLVVLAACIWCMASSAYAAHTDGQTGTHGQNTGQSSQSGASSQLYGDSTGSGQGDTSLASPTHPPRAQARSSCDDGGASAGLSPHLDGCSGSSRDSSSGGTGDAGGNGSGSRLGWQSLLPGSIQ